MSGGKQKVNRCFACGNIDFSTEHHVKELGKEYTVELCHECHPTLNHYYEEALLRRKKFLEDNS